MPFFRHIISLPNFRYILLTFRKRAYQMAENQPTQQPNKPLINLGIISGRIEAKRKIKTAAGDLYLTVCRLPAVNEFEHPATVELRSYDPLGDIGETVSVRVRLGGLPNNYDTKTIDQRTGEELKTPVKSARNEYTVIS